MSKTYEKMAELISEVGKFGVRAGGYSEDPQQATRDRNELIRSRRGGTLGNPTTRTELAGKVKIARKPASWITSLEGPDKGQIVPGTRENDPRGALKPGQVGSWTNLGREELKRGRERTDTSTEETGMNKIYERIAELILVEAKKKKITTQEKHPRTGNPIKVITDPNYPKGHALHRRTFGKHEDRDEYTQEDPVVGV